MSQVLKEDVRNKIVKSAKTELLNNGYEKASLRKIALKSGITVGNLYRYFENKETLVDSIISPTLKRINNIVKVLTNNNISINKDVTKTNLDRSQMINNLNVIGNELTDIYFESPQEVIILLMYFENSTNLKRWIQKLFFSFIKSNYDLKDKEEQMMFMSKAYSTAVISGFIELLKDNKLPKESVKNMINIYLGSFVGLLDTDIYKLAGD